MRLETTEQTTQPRSLIAEVRRAIARRRDGYAWYENRSTGFDGIQQVSDQSVF
jgi:hypothetical protein